MFSWYERAAVCFTYLADVEDCNLSSVPNSPAATRFCSSRWFIRGWTLQELIAPVKVEFFTVDWRLIGTRGSLIKQIQYATEISSQDMLRLDKCSVARRMSWAAKRQTTRAEDLAYCLVGLFGVNMPLYVVFFPSSSCSLLADGHCREARSPLAYWTPLDYMARAKGKLSCVCKWRSSCNPMMRQSLHGLMTRNIRLGAACWRLTLSCLRVVTICTQDRSMSESLFSKFSRLRNGLLPRAHVFTLPFSTAL